MNNQFGKIEGVNSVVINNHNEVHNHNHYLCSCCGANCSNEGENKSAFLPFIMQILVNITSTIHWGDLILAISSIAM